MDDFAGSRAPCCPFFGAEHRSVLMGCEEAAALFVDAGERLRRTGYLVEQLVQQRTATELSALGSGSRIVALASKSQGSADAIVDRLLSLLTRGSAITGTIGGAMLAVSLVVLIVSGVGGAGVAAGILGVLSGIEATRGAAFALGDVIGALPIVGNYRKLVGKVVSTRHPLIATRAQCLEAEGVSVQYPASSGYALQDASIIVRRGEMVAFVGANGAGKTSLVNALLGIAPAVIGSVTIDGRPVNEMPAEERISYFGLLAQEFGRYELTVRDAILLGLPPNRTPPDDHVWKALAESNLSEHVRSLPDGLDTQLGEQFGGPGLSGGQWQRLALARIAVRGAPIWVLDEPTSAVDAETERQIFGELAVNRSDRITIVVSHRVSTLRHMDRIYVFDFRSDRASWHA
ncbi:ATP-binding cassette domain-containing protein [Microlunatus sp. GCM10028923]|uniref:ATP-binding cassette domain-containing protein n=1 Tax=Microlunatus sp. GCM10028923 TaxID=3273400 RepID=UPI00361E6D06